MATIDEIKALFNPKFDSLHEKLSEQAKEQNDLLRFTKAISNDITDAQSGIEQLRASLETLSLASTATSQAFDKLIERIVALEGSKESSFPKEDFKIDALTIENVASTSSKGPVSPLAYPPS